METHYLLLLGLGPFKKNLFLLGSHLLPVANSLASCLGYNKAFYYDPNKHHSDRIADPLTAKTVKFETILGTPRPLYNL